MSTIALSIAVSGVVALFMVASQFLFAAGGWLSPLGSLAEGLRRLSLSGAPGNVAAWVLYALVCLLPVGAMVLGGLRKGFKAEHGLMALLSLLLFPSLYGLINPGVLPLSLALGGGAIFDGAALSLVVAYAVLRLVRALSTAGLDRQLRLLSQMLGLLVAAFTLAACLAVYAAIPAVSASSGADRAFRLLGTAVAVLPLALDVWVICGVRRLLAEFRRDRYGDICLLTAQAVGRRCALALAITVLVNALFALLQLIFSGWLSSVNVSVSIPISSIAFVLASLLLARLIAEGKQLKDDNDGFI